MNEEWHKKLTKDLARQVNSFFVFCATFIGIGGGLVAFNKLVSSNEIIIFIGLIGLILILINHVFKKVN